MTQPPKKPEIRAEAVGTKAGRRKTDQLPPPCMVVGETLSIGKEIRQWLKILTILTVVVSLIVGGLGAWTWVQNRQNTAGLCALRDDAQRRVDNGRDFLSTNPRGIPGIPPAQIENSIRNAIQTVDSLSKVGCPPLPLLNEELSEPTP